jgi:hypothetical protein
MSAQIYNIQPGKALLGIRVWVQWYAKRKPRFELFEYIGWYHDKVDDKKYFYFRSKTEGSIIRKSFADLNKNGFKPFLLNLKKIREYYKKLDEAKGIE